MNFLPLRDKSSHSFRAFFSWILLLLLRLRHSHFLLSFFLIWTPKVCKCQLFTKDYINFYDPKPFRVNSSVCPVPRIYSIKTIGRWCVCLCFHMQIFSCTHFRSAKHLFVNQMKHTNDYVRITWWQKCELFWLGIPWN